MHDIRAIRENPQALKDAMLRRKKPEEAAKVDIIVDLDTKYRAALTEKETLLARRNAASKEIGQAMAAKDIAKAEALKSEVAAGKARIAALEAVSDIELRDILAAIPNIPLDEVPDGADEKSNKEFIMAAKRKEEKARTYPSDSVKKLVYHDYLENRGYARSIIEEYHIGACLTPGMYM